LSESVSERDSLPPNGSLALHGEVSKAMKVVPKFNFVPVANRQQGLREKREDRPERKHPEPSGDAESPSPLALPYDNLAWTILASMLVGWAI